MLPQCAHAHVSAGLDRPPGAAVRAMKGCAEGAAEEVGRVGIPHCNIRQLVLQLESAVASMRRSGVMHRRLNPRVGGEGLGQS